MSQWTQESLKTIEGDPRSYTTQKDTRKGGSLRIDSAISKTIRHICVDGEVTRETLIEALIEFYQKHPEAQPKFSHLLEPNKINEWKRLTSNEDRQC
jgi:hypothetical protein